MLNCLVMAEGHVLLKVHENFENKYCLPICVGRVCMFWSEGDRVVGGGRWQKFEFLAIGRRPILNNFI